MSTKSPRKLSADTQFILQRLINGGVEDDNIPYCDLNALIQRDVQKGARGNLRSARKIAQQDYGFVFICVPDWGLKRLVNSDIPVMSNANRLKRIKGQVNNWQAELSCVDYDRLNKTARSEYNLGLTLAGTMAVISSQKPIDELKKVVANSSTGTLSLSATLDVFKFA